MNRRSLLGSATMLFAPAIIRPARARLFRNARGVFYADGASGASTGSVQHSTLLSGYVARPPWKVAGVDYAVGPNSTPSSDPATMSISGTSVNTTSRTVTVTGNNVTIDGYDFSLHSGYVIEIASGATNTTISNCIFANGTNTDIYMIKGDAGSSGITVKYCTMDGQSNGSNNAFFGFSGSGAHTIEYNWLKNFAAHIVDFNQQPGVTFSVVYKYNMEEQGGMVAGAHLNYSQFDSGTASAVNIDFNTLLQNPQASGGEGYQIATGFGAALTLNNPSVSYNTMISAGASLAISTFIHGPVGDSNNTTTGAGVITSNYFDLTEATQAYYPGSFTSAAWTVSGGINMVTGAGISYP